MQILSTKNTIPTGVQRAPERNPEGSLDRETLVPDNSYDEERSAEQIRQDCFKLSNDIDLGLAGIAQAGFLLRLIGNRSAALN